MNHYPDFKNTKHQLRKEALAMRSDLPIESISPVVCSHLERWEFFTQAPQVLFYHPFRNEVNLLALTLKFPEKKWYLPVVTGTKTTLAFYQFETSHTMQIGKYGIWEPPPHAQPLGTLNREDMMLIPGLLFDREGYRLGYGKGYYDRFLTERHQKNQSCVKTGILAQAFLRDSIPHDTWDQRMDFLMTETGLMPVRKDGTPG